MLTFRAINVDVLKFTKVSAVTFPSGAGRPVTAGAHVSIMTDTVGTGPHRGEGASGSFFFYRLQMIFIIKASEITLDSVQP